MKRRTTQARKLRDRREGGDTLGNSPYAKRRKRAAQYDKSKWPPLGFSFFHGVARKIVSR